jgi:hypothetical protein
MLGSGETKRSRAMKSPGVAIVDPGRPEQNAERHPSKEVRA